VSSSIRLGLVGNPENRRIRDFRAAWLALGQPEPTLIDYLELPGAAPRVDVLRLDSPGENAALATHLIALGGGPQDARLEFGEVAYLREFHQGYCELLRRVEAWCLPSFSAPVDIAAMFDKWQCHQRFVKSGLPRPPAALAPTRYPDWRAQIPEQGRVFLKPLHGSSSSGVCALRWTSTRQQLKSPIRIAGGRLYNSLRVRTYETWAEIEFILARLLPHGMIVETWIPKLSLPDGSVDVRILVIAGEARHSVVRQSHSPMTNLHLGNKRANPDGLEETLQAASRVAMAAANCFPDSLHAGVDVLLDARGQGFVGEINAFGDLLPGVNDRGEDAFTAIAKAYLSMEARGSRESQQGACARVNGALNGRSLRKA
jgi:glutathione synthase/RimK-type ligase-like ATP-grasp enzyme